MVAMKLTFAMLVLASLVPAADITAWRFAENPLISADASSSIVGDNTNGPSVIRVPDWVPNRLGTYYMYFAHHKGMNIRLAYADSLHGPWKVYDPGVLHVSETAFYRPQPDPVNQPPGVYTHVASPEVVIDEANRQIVMWVHGLYTEGKRFPDNPQEASAFMRANNYAQFTQAAVSKDGLHFTARPEITRDPYLRVFPYKGEFYGIVRLGLLVHAKNMLDAYELGPSPFRDTPYNNRVRHVALLPEGDTLHIFLSVIGTAPEKILYTSMSLQGDWQDWKVGEFDEVLSPEASYECSDLPTVPSQVGEIYGPARQLRDPGLFVENGEITLFYTNCGEQGISAAQIQIRKP